MTSNKVKATEIIGNDIILTIDAEGITVMEQLRDAVRHLWPNKKFIVVAKGKLELLQEKDMNLAGWYRKGTEHE